MDSLLSKITQQAMNYAIRSGIAVTSGYAISQCSRLLKTKDGNDKEELESLQRRLQSKIQIISPAIDMIELITARGNTSLESALSLTKSLRWQIQTLGARLANAASDEELSRKKSSKAKSRAQIDEELDLVIADMRKLLGRIEDAVPLINLAITTSGVSLTTNLPASVSPSRLLQASTFLSAGDAHYVSNSSVPSQIGPTFTLSMYMLFSGHASRLNEEEDLRQSTWQEVIHKARVKLVRTSIENVKQFAFTQSDVESFTENGSYSRAHSPTGQSRIPGNARADEFAYQLSLIEDLDDGRVHTFDEDETQPGSFDDVKTAGIREIVAVHEISKIFYADTGKILNIGSNDDTNNPVLLLKRDVHASPPRRMMDSDVDHSNWESYADHSSFAEDNDLPIDEDSEIAAQFERDAPVNATRSNDSKWRLPPGLDPEWIALEVYVDDPESDTESESPPETDDLPPTESQKRPLRQPSPDRSIATALSDLQLESSPARQPHTNRDLVQQPHELLDASSRSLSRLSAASNGVRTSLSLLEMLIRLTSLQQFQQASHLTITDELLNFFLEDSSTTGAAPGDADARRRIRADTRQRVGFDPYNESPIRRRGERHKNYARVGNNDANERSWSSPLRTPNTR